MAPDPWREVGSGVYVRSYAELDVNICVVRDDDDLVVIDSRASPAQGAELLSDLGVFAPARVVTLINTHAHFDHVFGNQLFGSEGLNVPIVGHHLIAAHLDTYERPRLTAWRADHRREAGVDWSDLHVTAPTDLVSARTTIRCGSRSLDIRPLPPGHTDTDVVVHVEDTGVWVVGDVVEASGPPMYGSGCYPLGLPAQVATLIDWLGDDDIVVPGHGPVVDKGFVTRQLSDVSAVAARLRLAHHSGASVEQALSDQRGWVLPVEGLELAARRAYDVLDQEVTDPSSSPPPVVTGDGSDPGQPRGSRADSAVTP